MALQCLEYLQAAEEKTWLYFLCINYVLPGRRLCSCRATCQSHYKMPCTESKNVINKPATPSRCTESVYIEGVRMWWSSFRSLYSLLWQAVISGSWVWRYCQFKHTLSSAIPKLSDAISDACNTGATQPVLVGCVPAPVIGTSLSPPQLLAFAHHLLLKHLFCLPAELAKTKMSAYNTPPLPKTARWELHWV